MDEDEFDAELSSIDSLSEPEVLGFLARHHHLYTSCDFCDELMHEYGDGTVLELLGRYEDAGILPPSAVVEAMCGLTLGPLSEALRDTGNRPPIHELIELTKLADCTVESYDRINYLWDIRWFAEQEWSLESVRDFVLERAKLQNAPVDFAKLAIEEFHSWMHAGPVEACEECQSVIQEAA